MMSAPLPVHTEPSTSYILPPETETAYTVLSCTVTDLREAAVLPRPYVWSWPCSTRSTPYFSNSGPHCARTIGLLRPEAVEYTGWWNVTTVHLCGLLASTPSSHAVCGAMI